MTTENDININDDWMRRFSQPPLPPGIETQPSQRVSTTADLPEISEESGSQPKLTLNDE
jgi:hypothetical protein